MRNREDDEQEPTGKTAQDILEELETVTFHLNSLYQRLSQDRDSWAVTGGDLASAVGELQQHIQKFGAVGDTLQQQLAKCIQQESKHAAMIASDAMKQAAKDVLEKEVGSATERLDNVVARASAILGTYGREMSHVRIWYVVILIVGAVLGGAIGAWCTNYAAGTGSVRAGVEQAPSPEQAVRKPRTVRGS
jgi:hypothetical protein